MADSVIDIIRRLRAHGELPDNEWRKLVKEICSPSHGKLGRPCDSCKRPKKRRRNDRDSKDADDEEATQTPDKQDGDDDPEATQTPDEQDVYDYTTQTICPAYMRNIQDPDNIAFAQAFDCTCGQC